MSFFDNTEPTTGSMEMGGGDFEPIPKGTEVLAFVEDGKIDVYEGIEKVKLTWVVLQPVEYKDRKVFQNIKVFDEDPAVAAKARKMLAAIDFNAGGKLLATGQAPDDMNVMAALSMKQMVLKLAVWDMNDKKGNWVTSVGAKGSSVPKAAPAPVVAPNAGVNPDNIPF